MRRILDRVVLGAIGQVNRLVFALSRGRIVLYEFRGLPGILLTITTPATPLGTMTDVACLLDDDSYLVLASRRQEAELYALLNSGETTVKAARGAGETAVHASLDRLIDPTERTAALKRVLSDASLEEGAEVRQLGLSPVARLRLHRPFPETGRAAFAVSIFVEDTEPPSDVR